MDIINYLPRPENNKNNKWEGWKEARPMNVDWKRFKEEEAPLFFKGVKKIFDFYSHQICLVYHSTRPFKKESWSPYCGSSFSKPRIEIFFTFSNGLGLRVYLEMETESKKTAKKLNGLIVTTIKNHGMDVQIRFLHKMNLNKLIKINGRFRGEAFESSCGGIVITSCPKLPDDFWN